MKTIFLFSFLIVSFVSMDGLAVKRKQTNLVSSKPPMRISHTSHQMAHDKKKIAIDLKKIDPDSAKAYVSNYRKWTRTNGNYVSLCSTSRDTLKWVRLINKTITSHIGIQLEQLDEISEHDGIRIYPSIDEKGEQNYILVYTNIIPNTKWHEDDTRKVFLLKMKIKEEVWCKLSDKRKNKGSVIFTSHHMCEPDCLYDKTRY